MVHSPGVALPPRYDCLFCPARANKPHRKTLPNRCVPQEGGEGLTEEGSWVVGLLGSCQVGSHVSDRGPSGAGLVKGQVSSERPLRTMSRQQCHSSARKGTLFGSSGRQKAARGHVLPIPVNTGHEVAPKGRALCCRLVTAQGFGLLRPARCRILADSRNEQVEYVTYAPALLPGRQF